MKLLNSYKNGNVRILIFDDGTRIINIPDDEKPNLEFPLSMDFKITKWCDQNCPMCHEKTNINGKHADIMNLHFIDKLHKGTEIAIGGGKVTSHPDLKPFLRKLKSLGVIPSITVHQEEYKKNKTLINELLEEKLIYGLGISFFNKDDEFWKEILKNENVVVHLIAGIHEKNIFDYLSNLDCKILILGYKNWGRGMELLNTNMSEKIRENIQWLKENLAAYKSNFKVVSFDNKAIEQLNVQDLLTDDEWKEFYQGDDGTMTMYVDGVNQQFAKTSTSEKRYDLLDNIEDMFKIIKEND